MSAIGLEEKVSKRLRAVTHARTGISLPLPRKIEGIIPSDGGRCVVLTPGQ